MQNVAVKMENDYDFKRIKHLPSDKIQQPLFSKIYNYVLHSRLIDCEKNVFETEDA